MNVFELRNILIDDFQAYITSFIKIQDPEIAQFVDDQISKGLLWPDPLIQLNPSFKPALTIDELISEDLEEEPIPEREVIVPMEAVVEELPQEDEFLADLQSALRELENF